MRTIEKLRKEIEQSRQLLHERFPNESNANQIRNSSYVPICEREDENPLDNFYNN